MSDETVKYKLVFLPDAEYLVIERALMGRDDTKSMRSYDALSEKGIENFMFGEGRTVFIPTSFEQKLRMKAKRGEQL